MSSGAGYETFDVPVAGGGLRAGRWGRGPVVLAAHGITGSHVSWRRVAELLAGRASLVAVDLRGRGGSAGLPGPYGMAAHADDLVAVLDHLGVDRAVVAGHSMGGFVATNLAVRHAGRVEACVLVDGGLALEVPEGVDVDAVLRAVIGPAMQRLAMTFPSREAYRDFWRAHPAFADPSLPWDDVVAVYVDYDLTGEPPALRSVVDADAVRADAADTLVGDGSRDAVWHAKAPMQLLWAPRGLLNQEPGLYHDEALRRFRDELSDFTDEPVADTNHYSILIGPAGARAVADAIVSALERT